MSTKETPIEPTQVITTPAKPVNATDRLGCLKTLAGLNETKTVTFKERAVMLRDLAIKNAKVYIKSFVEQVTAPINAIIDQLSASWDQAKALYTGRNELAQKLKREALEKLPPIPPMASGAVSCLLNGTIPLSADVLNPIQDPTKPVNVVTTSIVGTIESTPPSNNPANVGILSSADLIKKQQDSDSKLSKSEKATVVLSRMTDSLSGSPSDMRDTIESVSGKHPDLDTIISLHPLGQPYSEYASSSITSYTPDKPSLPLGQWKQITTQLGDKAAKPEAIKRNIRFKLPPKILVEIDYAYDKTNEQLLSNLPNEFQKGSLRITGGVNVKGGTKASGFHLLGDKSFLENHIQNPIFLTPYLTSVLAAMGPKIYLNKALTPSTDNITISKNPYQDNVELYPCTLDARGNIIREPIKTVNESSIKPVVTN